VKTVPILLLITLAASPALAEDALYAGDYLTMGFGARAMALGGAYSALATDAAAPAYNPAGLAMAGNYGGLFMHASRFDNLVLYDTLSGYYSFGKAGGTLGLSWVRTAIDDIKLTRWDDDGLPEVYKTVNTAADAFQLSYARELAENLSAGLTLKYLHDDVGVGTADGFGFDAGLLWQINDNAAVALVAHDPYTSKTWDTGTTDTFDPRVVLGGAWSVDMLTIDSRLTLSLDLDFILADYGEAAQVDLEGAGLDLHGGLEILISDVFAARVGADRGKLTLGGGVQLWGFSVDYCFLSHELGQTHRVSIQAGF